MALEITKEKTYTLKEVAEIFHVAPITIYKWVGDKKLIGFKVGKNWLFTETSLNEFVNKYKKKS